MQRRWIEWPAFERDAKRMLNYLLDVGIVPFIDQRDEGTIRFTVKEPAMRFLEQVRDVLIVSMIASFIWFGVYVVVLDAALGAA